MLGERSNVLLMAARRALIAAGNRLAARGLVNGSSGNLSCRVGDHVLVTPSGLPIAGLQPAQLVVLALGGSVVEGDLVPTSETPLHLAMYRATDAGAIAHAHAVHSAAVASVCTAVPPLHYNCVLLGGPLLVAPYATYGSDELAANVVTTLGSGRTAALMANHGSIAYGADIGSACDRLELVEWLCQHYCQAVALGTPRPLSDDELVAAAQRYGLPRATTQTAIL